ncbi:hypothetical protein MMC24_002060 [Lignoscripta atroalba]|nr:hypothetical protein [Lignoscripta atroalba]
MPIPSTTCPSSQSPPPPPQPHNHPDGVTALETHLLHRNSKRERPSPRTENSSRVCKLFHSSSSTKRSTTSSTKRSSRHSSRRGAHVEVDGGNSDELDVDGLGDFCTPTQKEWSWNTRAVEDADGASQVEYLEGWMAGVGEGKREGEERQGYRGILEQIEEGERDNHDHADGRGESCAAVGMHSGSECTMPPAQQQQEHLPSEGQRGAQPSGCKPRVRLDLDEEVSLGTTFRDSRAGSKSSVTLSVEEEQVFFERVRKSFLLPAQRSIADDILRKLDRAREGCPYRCCKEWRALKVKVKKMSDRRHGLKARAMQSIQELCDRIVTKESRYVDFDPL